jgi:hypothetical protein
MKKTTWGALDPKTRAELEALLRDKGDAFESDYLDALAWWLFGALLCVGGIGASIWDLATDTAGAGVFDYIREYPLDGVRVLLTSPRYLGLIAALIVGPWIAVTWVRNVGRRGIALTKDALVLVRGPKLLVVPIADMAHAEQRVIKTKKQTFTVLTVQMKDGRKKDFYCHGSFAALARERLPA